MGRIGNQLFQVASTIGVATKNGCDWGFPEWDNPFSGVFFNAPEGRYRTVKVPWGYHQLTFDPKDNISLQGYMQSEKYFKHCESLIRMKFTFTTPPTPAHDDFISVHLRRGDYDGQSHAILGMDYYKRALAKLPDRPIYVFTDDEEAGRSMFPEPVYVSPQGTDPWMDIAMMTKASYHIIANSSFSWWGAWLSQSDKVIAPKEWFGIKKNWDTSDIYCKTWEII
jgi:hypothetical protein